MSTFNPSDFGATPVQSSKGFNPSDFGATPVASTPDQAPKQSLADSIWSGLAGVGKNIANDFSQRGKDLTQGIQTSATDIQQGTQKEGIKGTAQTVKGIFNSGLQTTGAVAGGVADIFKNVLSPLVNKTANFITNPDNTGIVAKGIQQLAQTHGVGKVLDSIDKAGGSYDTWAKAHPNLSKDLEATLNIGGLVAGEKPVQNAVDTTIDATKGAIKAAPEALQGAKDALLGTPAEQAAKQATKNIQSSIEAVNPDLSGKKLVSAYKQTVGGAREITPSSIFREQGLTPDQQTVNLGTRLHDIGLTNDPVKNLEKLGSALKTTETKVTELLKGDPEVNYNANKPELLSNLNKAKTNIPREFTSIKDSKAVFNNVIDFAKETVGKTPDTIEGIRDARTSFDAQAKAEYPSAFKEGKIDTATPAGRAIKQARDLINEHLYNTAPNGSEIQKLIGRESDIFRATDNIAPKAAKGHGNSLITKVSTKIKEHPIASAIGTVAIDKALKATTGLGF